MRRLTSDTIGASILGAALTTAPLKNVKWRLPGLPAYFLTGKGGYVLLALGLTYTANC